MRRILLSLVSVFAALGLTFVATPASAAPADSDDVGILAIVGTFTLAGVQTPIVNNQVCAPAVPNSVAALNAIGIAMDERVVFFTDAACAVAPTGVVLNPTNSSANLGLTDLFYSSS